MLFDIDGKSHIPKYEQIVAQVIFGVASGSLRPGEMLPGVRERGPAPRRQFQHGGQGVSGTGTARRGASPGRGAAWR